jgi:DNA-directed RNA polymerase specialized sigma24 family protein
MDVVRHEVARMSGSETQRRKRFDRLFESYGPDIVAYCSWRTPSPSDAQDAVADVFLTAWRRLDEVPDGTLHAFGSTRRRVG